MNHKEDMRKMQILYKSFSRLPYSAETWTGPVEGGAMFSSSVNMSPS